MALTLYRSRVLLLAALYLGFQINSRMGFLIGDAMN